MTPSTILKPQLATSSMPALVENQIKAKIADGSISAISVDTAVFDAYGCNLDHSVLARLDQFKTGEVKLLLSEVVVKEITAHIARDASETKRALKTALKKHDRRWRLQKDLEQLEDDLALDADTEDVSRKQVDAFLTAVGAEVIAASGQGDLAAEVLRHYFEVIAPFEPQVTKKHEFPDAFALLSLEQAAQERGTLLLCVTPDKGWAKFAMVSDHLVVVPKLDIALSWFNPTGSKIAESLLKSWKADAAPEVVTEVESAFEYYLESVSFDVEADSPAEYEVEPLTAVLQYVHTDKIEPPVVVADDRFQVTLSMKVVAKVGFEANFSFFAYDSVDRDRVALDSSSLYRERDLPFEVMISMSRQTNDGPFDILEVNVTSSRIVVNFGYVEPFPDEDPTHEQY